MAVGMGKWRSWMGWKRASTHSLLRLRGVCGCDGLFKESGSRELTEKESWPEEDTKEKTNANATAAANPNVDGRVASGSISASSSWTSISREVKGQDRREAVNLSATFLPTVSSSGGAEENMKSSTIPEESRFGVRV